MSDALEGVVEKLRAGTAGELMIGGEIGRGGMAAVFLAYDLRLNRRVAIKVMSPALMIGEGLVERFADEAVTMANLRHPNIITVHSVRQIEDIHFFVMEFVAGRALDRVLQHSGALAVPVAQAILWQVGSALSYAHRRGVVHRDIKPANILIDGEGSALVTDFGIARVVETPGRTQTGILVGTPAYMSPEQCYGSPVDAATDQYALGIVAYEMLTGTAPFSGTSFAVMQAHTQRDVPPLRDARPDLPVELECAVLRMLAKDPAQRWPTLREALSALGAHPLDDADPVRGELAHLATLGDAPAAASESITPPGRPRDLSPAPLVSVPASGRDENRLYLIVAEPPAPIAVGDRFVMSAVICREQGTIVVDRRVEWTSSDPRIARIDKTSGAVRALAPGKATLTASAHGLADPVTIDVLPARPVVAARPSARDGRGKSPLLGASALGVVLASVVLVWAITGAPQPSASVGRSASMAPPPTADVQPTQAPDTLLPLPEPQASATKGPTAPIAKRVAAPPPNREPRRAPASSLTPAFGGGERFPVPVPPPSMPEVATMARDSVVVAAAPTSVPERAPAALDSVAAASEPDRPTTAQARAAAEQCARAVQGKDVAKLLALANASAGADRRRLDALIALMRDDGANLVVATPVYRAPQLGDTGASTELSMQLSWRSAFGGQRASTATFRSELRRVAGEWQLTDCRLVAAARLQ